LPSFVTPSSTITVVREVQFWNALVPKFAPTPAGTVIVVREAQSLNALLGIVVIWVRSIALREAQPLNPCDVKVITELGRPILSRDLQ
jgi:hypothetical protein